MTFLLLWNWSLGLFQKNEQPSVLGGFLTSHETTFSNNGRGIWFQFEGFLAGSDQGFD